MKTNKTRFFKLLKKAARPVDQPKQGKSRRASGGYTGKKTRPTCGKDGVPSAPTSWLNA